MKTLLGYSWGFSFFPILAVGYWSPHVSGLLLIGLLLFAPILGLISR